MTDPKIVKTVLTPVESPAIDAQDILPTDTEALELAEQELSSTKEALDTVDAENDRLHAALREAEELIAYMFANGRTNEDKEKRISEIVLSVNTRLPAPKFKR